VLLTLAMGVGLACGPIGAAQPDGQDEAASGEAGGAASSASRADSVLPLAPDPVTVRVTLDAAGPAEMNTYVRNAEWQGEDGLAIELSSLHATVALQAVEGGVMEPLPPPLIQMTGIAGLEGLPPGVEFVAGAQLDPSGWRVYYPAWLTLTLPPGTSALDLIGFAYEADGDQFHLYPVRVSEAGSADEGPTVRMDIFHFSGYGVVRASPEAAEGIGAPEPLSLQAEHALAQLSARDLNGARGQAILLDWYTQGVAARAAAAGNCARTSGTTDEFIADSNGLLDAAIEFLEWTTAVENASQEGAFEQQIQDAAFSLWEKVDACLDSVCELCLMMEDGQVAHRMLALSSVHQFVVGTMAVAPLDSTNWTMLSYACFANNDLLDQFERYPGMTGGNAGDGGGGAPEIPTSCP
jgi:hypothetical protein